MDDGPPATTATAPEAEAGASSTQAASGGSDPSCDVSIGNPSQASVAVHSRPDGAAGSEPQPLTAVAAAPTEESHNSNPNQNRDLPFVAPSSYLRPNLPSHNSTMSSKKPTSLLDKEQMLGLVGCFALS
jgi:hypothetical protein